jgi:quinol monooxygenase YgiN
VAFALIARWRAKPGEEEHVLEALRRLAGPSRAEPGCLMWEGNRDPEDPRSFVLYEQYVDRAAYEAHLASEHFTRLAKADALGRLEDRRRELLETLDL